MNKELLLIVVIINILIFVIVNSNISDLDKKMVSIILISYLAYILLHEIPNFEYYSVKYSN